MCVHVAGIAIAATPTTELRVKKLTALMRAALNRSIKSRLFWSSPWGCIPSMCMTPIKPIIAVVNASAGIIANDPAGYR